MRKADMKEGATMYHLFPTKNGLVVAITVVDEVREGSRNMSPWSDVLDQPTLVRREEKEKFKEFLDSLLLPIPRKID